jgi:hypothetical protein
MAEFIITTGSVMFEDAVKKPVPGTEPQYFPTKRARVELYFEGGEEAIDHVMDLAAQKVAEMLGDAHRSPSVHPQETPSDPQTTRRPRRTRAEMEAAKSGAGAQAGAEPKPTSSGGGEQTSVDDPFASTSEGSTPASEGSSADEGDDWGAVAEVKEITDADLTDAVTKRNAVLKNAQAIRVLIGTFVSPPKGLKDIPQDQRGLFLGKLAELKG